MRKKFIAGNWKMHKNTGEAEKLAESLVSSLAGDKNKIMIAPSYTALTTVGKCLEASNILLGAQNMGQEEQGAHTGEISVLMLKDIGVSVVILGHSERRHVYDEDDALINKKVHLALKHDLEVILCVGETLEQREKNITTEIIETQIRNGLKGISKIQLQKVTIAYEPVWAIGTGKTATPADADEIHRFIRDVISKLYDRNASESIIIQYGGSVKPNNAAELMNMDQIDGVLVGGASLECESFVQIVKY